MKNIWHSAFYVTTLFALMVSSFLASHAHAQPLSPGQSLERSSPFSKSNLQWYERWSVRRTAQAIQSSRPPKRCSPSCDVLRTKAREIGYVSVIVGLEIPNLPDSSLKPHASDAEQDRMDQMRADAIREAQDQLLKRLANRKITHIIRFTDTSAIGFAVDPATLEDLIADPGVSGIGEDMLMKPMLYQSVPLIGADQAWANGFTGKGYAIAILDTGIDSAHYFLKGKVVALNTKGGHPWLLRMWPAHMPY